MQPLSTPGWSSTCIQHRVFLNFELSEPLCSTENNSSCSGQAHTQAKNLTSLFTPNPMCWDGTCLGLLWLESLLLSPEQHNSVL